MFQTYSIHVEQSFSGLQDFGIVSYQQNKDVAKMTTGNYIKSTNLFQLIAFKMQGTLLMSTCGAPSRHLHKLHLFILDILIQTFENAFSGKLGCKIVPI